MASAQCMGDHRGDGIGASTLSKEGESKTPLSLMFPPSGSQSKSDMDSAERNVNSPSLAGLQQVVRRKRFFRIFRDVAGERSLLFFLSKFMFFLSSQTRKVWLLLVLTGM